MCSGPCSSPRPSSHHATQCPGGRCRRHWGPGAPRERRSGTGLWVNERCDTAVDGARVCPERAGARQRFPGGYETPPLLCSSGVDATRRLHRGRGTFQAVFSAWRAGRGGASYKLLRIIDLELTACPPTHPQTQRPVVPLKGAKGRSCLCLRTPRASAGSGVCPPRLGVALLRGSPAASAPPAAASGCAQLQRWVLYTWSGANLAKPAHLVNTLRLPEDIIRPA